MLNDLRTIERGMTAYGISLVGRHPDIKDMAKGWAFRVRLAAPGHVVGVDLIEDAGRGAVWTLRDGQHNGFPGLKTAAGLLVLDAQARATHDQAWEADKASTSRRKELLRLFGTFPPDMDQRSSWPNAGHRKRIRERLDTLRSLSGDSLTAVVPAAFERFLTALDTTPVFLEGLTTALAERARDHEDHWLEPVRAALIGPTALVIDAAEPDFPRDASDLRQVGPVSAALSDGAASEVDAGKDGPLCAFGGKAGRLHTGNFPQPNLPGLGQTYIFSRNKDIPSLTRYGRTADASLPIDADLVRRLSGAITALTREDAKGKSWKLIPAETGDKPDLLVIGIADPGVRIADVIAGDDEDVASAEGALDQLGANVVQQSQGTFEQETPQDAVIVIVLRTVDPANRKAIYHRNTTAKAVQDAARRWQNATSNTPAWLGFSSPLKGGSELVFRKPPSVAPLSITPISRVQFANGGRRRVSVIGATAAEAFGLFLREGNVGRRARNMLRLLTRRHGALLIGLAAARLKGIEHLKDFDPKTDLRRDALRSVTWVGALLHHLGRSKEVYMSDAGFRLGQLLAAADTVHVGYCVDVRNGSIPSALIGNAVLGMAAGNPTKALGLLLRRWPPYSAWAARASTIMAKADRTAGQGNTPAEQRRAKSEAGRLRAAVAVAGRIRSVAAELKDQLRTVDPAKDSFKAELLLGYMAGLPPKTNGNRPAADQIDAPEEQDEGEQT